MTGLALVVAALAGCARSPTAADCQASADELSRFLATVDHEPSTVLDDWTYHLVLRADLPRRARPDKPILQVTSTQIIFQGQLVTTADLGPHLADSFRRAEIAVASDHGQSPPPAVAHGVYVLVDADVPWIQVVAVAAAAAGAGFDRPAWLFRRPAVNPPPPFDDLPPASAGANPYAACASLGKLFDALQIQEGGDKAESLIAGIGPALVDCRCAVDMPALRLGVWQLIGHAHPTSALEVTLARDATPIELPARMPWRDASKALVPDGRAWLVAR